ncbi:dihydroxyacetone kinase subunit DhaL [Paracoccus sp. Z330]|uniref:Dihydroxyacetone kinase subunit DhaL n=1 Tax=Paracoccus onchidii TaxID=3017813 RepID=A0ABT4ZI34_9RHOB|nr:dihydroxyacetone kinase subunit DhaL [Paracoccus onchidii]MDB6178411.1 dihydroxyacetone kinase subunit DhaL [Paracoccus onchidii]
MPCFTRSDLTTLFHAFAARMADERTFLGELDGEIGDADHGVAMANGFDAAAQALLRAEGSGQGLAGGFNLAAQELLNAVGATTGPLYASALTRAGEVFGEVASVPLARLPELVIAICEGVERRGQGKPGDKTMLDAWGPAAHVAARGLNASVGPVVLLREAAQAAAKGAEDTRAMMAARGRAARLGPRSIGHLDPGAVSAAALMDVLAEWARHHEEIA